jgi:hypothetical protein
VNEEQGENFDSSKKKVVTILDIVETYILFIKRMIVSILLIMQQGNMAVVVHRES